jgi:DNA-binding transcriptional MerR regulator
MADETVYTIGELADIAGVTPRTIRYYTAEGLLPRPDARGQYALYGEEHLLRLRLIGHLKQAYLPLGEIKARIADLDSQQIRRLLEEYREPPAPTAPASAADYLAHLHARQQLPQAPRHVAEQAEPYGVSSPSLNLRPPPAPDAPADSAPAAPIYGFAAPIAAPAPQLAPAEPPQQAGLLRKLIPPRRSPDAKSARADVAPEPNPAEVEQRWRRIALAPGVELHVREPAAAPLRERIEQLIALARTVLEIRD